MTNDLVVFTRPDALEEAGSRSKSNNSKVQEFLALARSRWQTIQNAERRLRADMLEDWRFRQGDAQWDPETKTARDNDGRACITINRLPQFIRQVTNAQREAQLAVKVLPVDDQADVKTAEVLQGLIRHIETQSDAQVAYGTAGDHQATMGRGYWTIGTEYEDERSFVQDIRIHRVRNPFTVFMDPTSMQADGSDARYGFVIEDMSIEEFKVRFPGCKVASLEEIGEIGMRWDDWMPSGRVRIGNYWYRDETPAKLQLVRFVRKDGSVAGEEALYEDEVKKLGNDVGLTVEVAATRDVVKTQVKQALISAVEVLEGNEERTAGRDWPGKWIPIVPVIGDEIDLNGELDLRGMVRDAKEPQRLYNYQNSTLAETLALVPRSPYIGYEGQFENHKSKWQQANRRAYAYLEVKPISINGQLAPLPQRISAGADIGAIMTAIQQSDNDLKATMGLYEPSLGIRQSASQSGKAIQALQKQGENANSNFLDNLSRAIRFTGRIIVDLIPHIYDAPRVIRIIGTDDKPKSVMVGANADMLPPQPGGEGGHEGAAEGLEGIDGVFQVGQGKYDVVCTAGTSQETKRREAFEALNSFVQAYPNAFPIVADLLMASLDWPGAQAAAERFKKLVPPEVQENPENSPEKMAAELSEAMAKLQEAGATIEDLQQKVEAKQLEMDARARIEAAKNESMEKIANLNAQVKLIQEQGKIEGAFALQRIKGEIAHLEQTFEHIHERGMAAMDRDADRIGRDDEYEKNQFSRAEERKAAVEDRSRDRQEQVTDRAQDRRAAVQDQARADAHEDARFIAEKRVEQGKPPKLPEIPQIPPNAAMPPVPEPPAAPPPPGPFGGPPMK